MEDQLELAHLGLAERLEGLTDSLAHSQQEIPLLKVAVGFDGYVDKIFHAVKMRRPDERLFFSEIKEFAFHIESLSGKSGQVELVLQETKIGGNAPILSHGLGSLGVKTQCIAAMGWPEVHPIFKGISGNVELVSVNDPSKSDAFEFKDGKLIFSECTPFDEFDWELIKTRLGLSSLKESISNSRLLAIVDWVNLPKASDIWKGLLEDIIKGNKGFCDKFFFDLCDPSRKSREEILEVLEIISLYKPYGEVVLGLNQNEANKIYQALTDEDPSGLSLIKIGKSIFDQKYVHRLLIHPTDYSISFADEGISIMPGRVVERPKVLTGAGDNFNAGFALGWMLGFEISNCLLLAMATSGAYIQTGNSPDIPQLIDYIRNWSVELTSLK